MVAVFERFTDQGRRAVVLAQQEARLLNHNYIGTEHLLLGVLHEGGVAAQALEAHAVTLEAARTVVEHIIGRGASESSGHMPFTPRAKEVLSLSLRESLALGHSVVGTEHILLGLVRERQGVAVMVMVKLGAELGDLRAVMIERAEDVDDQPEVIERVRIRLADDEIRHRRFLAWVAAHQAGRETPDPVAYPPFTLRCVSCAGEYIAGTVLCPECMGTDFRVVDDA